MYEYVGEVRYRAFWLGGDLFINTYKVKRLNKKTVTVSVRSCRYAFDYIDVKFKCVRCYYSTERISYNCFGKLDKDAKEVMNNLIKKMEVTYKWATKNLPLLIAGLKNLDVEGDVNEE